VALELPLLVVDVQRGGPSTGLPTKTEQADLLQAMFGRNGEAPVPIVAPQSPSDCFDAAIEAAGSRSDLPDPGHAAVRRLPGQRLRALAHPRRRDLPDLTWSSPPVSPNPHRRRPEEFWPFLRDPETLARPWAIPGTPGLEHRIGGLEKADGTGVISYDPDNHDFMVRHPPGQGRRIARHHPPAGGRRPDGDARVLVLGWGSTYGPIGAAVRIIRAPAARSPRPTCATSTRSRPTPGTCCAPTTGCSSRR
jgi:2-oxoglutarate/2-oxoacid ferredoxin oxidoreductase subunit alpha